MAPITLRAAPEYADTAQLFRTATGFVKKQGTDFELGGRLFRYGGANIPSVAGGGDQATALCAAAKPLGITVFRMWASLIQGPTSGWTKGLSAMPELGQYDEKVLVNLDRALDCFRRAGLKVILPFAGTGSDLSINPWLCFRDSLPARDMHDRKNASPFYSDPQIRQDFKDFIRVIIQRTNTVTGQKYRDDPTILAWELANETWHETAEWANDIAAFIKSQDSNHLVADSFLGGRDSPHIDIVQGHYYPAYEGPVSKLLEDARLARAANKIFIVGEWDWIGIDEKFDVDTAKTCASHLDNPAVAGDHFWILAGVAKGNFASESHYVYSDETRADRLERLAVLKQHLRAMNRGALNP